MVYRLWTERAAGEDQFPDRAARIVLCTAWTATDHSRAAVMASRAGDNSGYRVHEVAYDPIEGGVFHLPAPCLEEADLRLSSQETMFAISNAFLNWLSVSRQRNQL